MLFLSVFIYQLIHLRQFTFLNIYGFSYSALFAFWSCGIPVLLVPPGFFPSETGPVALLWENATLSIEYRYVVSIAFYYCLDEFRGVP